MSKKALLVGINDYRRAQWALRGCINDTIEMQDLLKTYFGFQDEGTRVLVDREATRQGIYDGLAWLLSDYDEGGSDVRVFYFSGRGTCIESRTSWDGVEPVLMSHDHDWEDPICTSDLRKRFDAIPEGGHLAFITDCCFAGTIQRAVFETEFSPRFDSPPVEVQDRIAGLQRRRDSELQAYQAARLGEMLQSIPPDQWATKMQELLKSLKEQFARERFGIVPYRQGTLRYIALAASESQQTAADVLIEDTWRGAFTWGLGKAIRETNGELTYDELIRRTGTNLMDYDQQPQLEYSGEMNLWKVFAPFSTSTDG
jgi:hypothetical protein